MKNNDNDKLGIFVGLDLFFAAIGVIYLLYEKLHLHPVFCILGGVAAAGILFALMTIKIIGIIIQVACSAFWALVIAGLLDKVFHFSNDPIWTWSILIVSFLVVLGSHIYVFDSFNTPSFKPHNLRKGVPVEYTYHRSPVDFSEDVISSPNSTFEELIRRYTQTAEDVEEAVTESERLYEQAMQILSEVNEYSPELYELEITAHTSASYVKDKIGELVEYENRIRNTYDSNEAKWIVNEMERGLSALLEKNKNLKRLINNVLDRMHAKNNSADQSNSSSSFEESLFNGCHDKESLTKRYRNLMKTFHPDTGNGDEEMAKKIQVTYKELLKRMS